MADVHPFKGLHYNSELPWGELLVPPYDVISPEEHKKLLQKDPHNYVRLLLGEGEENWHDGANDTLEKWKSDKTLLQDDTPAFYASEEEFIRPDTGEHFPIFQHTPHFFYVFPIVSKYSILSIYIHSLKYRIEFRSF